MTIGIDIRVLGSGRKSGIEEYTEHLLATMLPLDSSIDYKLFYSGYGRPLADYDWLHLPNVKLFKRRIPNRLLFYTSRFFNWPKLDKLVGGADVFFFPHFLPAALSEKCKRVTTFHDLSFERFPEFFSMSQRWWHYLVAPYWQSRFSDKIIAVSDSTKRDLIQFYGVDPARITTVYSGVSSTMTRPSLQEIEAFRHKRSLPEKFILFLGTQEPRKNIPMLIRAFSNLKENQREENTYLVITGNPGWLHREVKDLIQHSLFREVITFLETLHAPERPLLYAAASVLVYPSFFEGFGFPPLEAMACGTPVITSHASSLPEVVASAGLLADPYNASELARLMESTLNDQKLRNLLILRGLERAKSFSWQKAAEATLELIQSSI